MSDDDTADRVKIRRALISVSDKSGLIELASALTVAGVFAVAKPGGSMRAADVISAANSAGKSMYFTGTRHFFH